jgi:hypothetical protein
MRPRTAPLYRVLGGLSLALLWVPLGNELSPDDMVGMARDTAEDVAAAQAGAAVTAAAQRTQQLAPAISVPSTFPLASPCAPSCSTLLAGMEGSHSFWDAGPARAVPVSAPAVDEEAPPARGASVAIAFAQAAVQPAAAAPTPGGRYTPAEPVMPARPGRLWVEPVVTALFDPDAAEPGPTEGTAEPPTQPDAAAPQEEGKTPAAVPADDHAAPAPFDPLSTSPAASPGAPFKRGSQPSEKPGARAAAPLPSGTAPNGAAPSGNGPGPSGPADGTDPAHAFVPAGEAPNAAPASTPVETPRWSTPVYQGGGPGPATPSQPATPAPQLAGPGSLLPLIESIGPVVERIAGGSPAPGEHPLLAPRAEAALPSVLLVVAAVPEPSSLALFGIAAFCLAGLRRARRH